MPKLITRLITNRPLAFLNGCDDYLLRTGERGRGGFDNIGTIKQKEPLTLNNLLSYDEMQLSALLSVSVQTDFINDGGR